MATNAQVAELMTRTLAAIDALTARVVAIETAPAAQAQAHKGVARSAERAVVVDTCTCGASYKYGRTPREIAAAGALGLCGAKGRKSHRIIA